MSSSSSSSSSADLATVESTIGSSKTGKPVHLIVLCHGLWGEPKHLRTVETLLANSFGERATIINSTGRRKNKQTNGNKKQTVKEQKKAEKKRKEEEELNELYDKVLSDYSTERDPKDLMDVVILNTITNQGGRTYDGIDWLSERVLREIKEEQKNLMKLGKEVKRFSMIGYSLGGLVVRFVLGLLESQSFFNQIQPRQIITIATPHIGIPPAAGSFSRVAAYVGGRLLSRTGEQLYSLDQGWQAEDDGETKVGLLEYMSKPNSIFIRALNRFEKVHFYANAVNDFTVPFRTGCIELWDPFIEQQRGFEVKLLSKENPIITEIELFEPEKQPFLEILKQKVLSTPFFLNPKRLAVNFPYNYLLAFGLPILFPLFIGSVLYRLMKDSRGSKVRIAELERGWKADMEEEEQEDEENSKTNSSEARMTNLIKRFVIATGEENVESERDLFPNFDQDKNDSTKSVTIEQSKNLTKPPWHSPWIHDESPLPKKQPPLKQSQQNMVNNLNNPKNLPKLTKVWSYYPDVTNCHAIVVARLLSIQPHRRGLPVMKHLVDDFLP